ncbi:MAG: ABC transporter substrate-binding protein [Chloroflexota bacterium]
MKYTRMIIASLALASLLPFTGSAHGAAPVTAPPGLKTAGTLTIGTNIPYPPMESYTGANLNIPTGADIDLGTAIAGKMGLKTTWVNIPNFDTIIPALAANRFDMIMSSMGITAGREKTLIFVPYFLAGQSIVVAKGNPKHVQTIADLSGLTAGVQAATTESDALNAENAKLKKAGKTQISVKYYKQDSDALEQLELGRVQAYLTDYPVAAFYVQKRPSQLQIAGKQFGTQTYGIAIRKSDKPLQTAVSKALGLLMKDGQYRAILKKYNLSQGALK